MSVLSVDERRVLERAVVAGREVAEAAAAGAVTRLGVALRDAPTHLIAEEKGLRRALRARARQLGDPLDRSTSGDVQVRCGHLLGQVAYEQWHRLLFARFLEINGLLRHPHFDVSVTLEECEELAPDLGEPDGWAVAARFAAELLPGIFVQSDPCSVLRLAPEDRLALQRIVTDLPVGLFTTEDALGWVYQYWQSKVKDDVNESGRKIGGADLAPVTQLFTEDYMVRFLLENSLGAWWAFRHPDSRLVRQWEFLRWTEDGAPAAGLFEEWPTRAAEVTIMDPCCGSGHFLVAAFGMLWRMRAEEEGLPVAKAQDLVLRENLFGLELDPRCTQIAMFALALEAWKTGGYRTLPIPNVACSGIPAKAPLSEWMSLADGDSQLESALVRLHSLFADADTLGSLIDPVRAAEQAGLASVDWHDIAPLLDKALTAEAKTTGDPAAEVFGDAAAGIARAADYLSRRYTLVATNPPFLLARKQNGILSRFTAGWFAEGRSDLATSFMQRALEMVQPHHGSGLAMVLPQSWLFLKTYKELRALMLESWGVGCVAILGEKAFQSDAAAGAFTCLFLAHNLQGRPAERISFLDIAHEITPEDKSAALQSFSIQYEALAAVRGSPGKRLLPTRGMTGSSDRMVAHCDAVTGIQTGDVLRYVRNYWELPTISNGWEVYQAAANASVEYGGRSQVLFWEGGQGELSRSPLAYLRGSRAWGRHGVVVRLLRSLPVTLYTGELFDQTVAVLLPKRQSDLAAIWSYCVSGEFASNVREIDRKNNVTPATLGDVNVDLARWRSKAERDYPDGLPEPWSDDATQWLFKGVAAEARQPLQVAVARLVGFRWPDQKPEAVDALVDGDGIVCLPAVSGERPAAERVRAVLASSFGEEWSPARLDDLLTASGGKPGDLEGWLRGVFFKDHCRVFENRPFVWHIWDGRQDGFSALVNYHRLDGPTLQKLTFTYLGWWIERQRTDATAGVAGAEARFAAAVELQRKLALILAGEPPYDIYVRWKPVREQPLGWDPDLDDGVRVNIRPFFEAGVLRSTFNIHWRKDRGVNSDGSERHNDLHYTLAQKRAARATAP